jgi:hypothetical protein
MALHIKYIACFYLFPKYYYISLFIQLLNSDWFAFLSLGSFFRIYILVIIFTSNNSSRIELLWLVCDQSRSKYYLRTKFQDGIDKPQKFRNVCYHPTHQQQSDFLILVLYDFIVQNILSSLLVLCYNLMIMNDWLWINYKYSFYPSFIIWNTTNKTEM